MASGQPKQEGKPPADPFMVGLGVLVLFLLGVAAWVVNHFVWATR